LNSISYEPIENGEYAQTASGHVRAGIVNTGFALELRADYPMSDHQFFGLFEPWWHSPPRVGGCANGVSPFWLRDPFLRAPYRWIRLEGQRMSPRRDGVGWVVNLPLLRLPQ
jgi:hypothetical protein